MISGATTVLRAEIARLLATRAFHGAVALVAVAAAARAFLAGPACRPMVSRAGPAGTDWRSGSSLASFCRASCLCS